ncbi:MAG: oxidoreductase [Chitinophagaceae bacterium]|nr:oxidoreductase [Chitinophagaceae bacterium]
MRILIILLFIISCNIALSQTIKILTSGEKTSIRGLSVVNDKVIWVSGSNGTCGLSQDGGETWKWIHVETFAKTDFRDIEAFDDSTAVIMSVAVPAYILKTIDAGETWEMVYENKTKGMFLDAMEFWNVQNGIVIGDPIDNKFFVARTFDGGQTWKDIPLEYLPVADSGEACFASSGTNIKALGKGEVCFVSGGLRSRLFIRDVRIDLPILQGAQSTGANSIAVKNKKTLIIVGGDFAKPDSTNRNCFITNDGGNTWAAPVVAPHGYRSCVEYLGGNSWISCGLNGVDYSIDNGKKWQLISRESFHVCRKSKDGRAVFLAGVNGKIGKLVLK